MHTCVSQCFALYVLWSLNHKAKIVIQLSNGFCGKFLESVGSLFGHDSVYSQFSRVNNSVYIIFYRFGRFFCDLEICMVFDL